MSLLLALENLTPAQGGDPGPTVSIGLLLESSGPASTFCKIVAEPFGLAGGRGLAG